VVGGKASRHANLQWCDLFTLVWQLPLNFNMNRVVDLLVKLFVRLAIILSVYRLGALMSRTTPTANLIRQRHYLRFNVRVPSVSDLHRKVGANAQLDARQFSSRQTLPEK